MSLRWYEWIGWTVEALLVVLAGIFVVSTFSEGEVRPLIVSLGGFGVIIGIWTWVLVTYGKEAP